MHCDSILKEPSLLSKILVALSKHMHCITLTDRPKPLFSQHFVNQLNRKTEENGGEFLLTMASQRDGQP